jgi:hypothetical protein
MAYVALRLASCHCLHFSRLRSRRSSDAPFADVPSHEPANPTLAVAIIGVKPPPKIAHEIAWIGQNGVLAAIVVRRLVG